MASSIKLIPIIPPTPVAVNVIPTANSIKANIPAKIMLLI